MVTTRPGPATAVAEKPADARLWRAAASGALGLWVAYVLLPADQTGLRALVVYPAAETACVVAVVVGVRRYRPVAPAAWLLIAAALASTNVADVIYGVHQVAGVQPFPSPADLFYLAAYPLYAAGLALAGRVRAPEGMRGTFIDAAIVTVTAALFAALLISHKYIEDPDLSWVSTVVASAYPVADVLLLAVAVRFLLGVTKRTPALWLLTLGMALLLVGDTLYTVHGLFTSSGDNQFADAMLLGSVLSIGLAGLHPSMTDLTVRPPEVDAAQYTVRRTVVLYLISLVPVGVLAFQAAASENDLVWVTIVTVVVIAVLVVARFIDLVGQATRAGEREARLSTLGSDLLLLTGRDKLVAAAQQAVDDLVPGGTARVIAGGDDSGAAHGRFAAPVVVDGEQVAVVAADRELITEQGTQAALRTVARSLSLALERDSLMDAKQEAADVLSEQNKRLRELDRMKDQLVSSVSHELRTPLTSIGGYAEMLLSDEFGQLNEDQQGFVDVIDRNCRRLNRIVDDILFVARVDAGRLSLERSWVDLAEVAANSVRSAQPRAQHGQLSLSVTAADGLESVWADATRMTQMFDNLISNALKFTPPNGTVEITLTGTEDGVHIQVADSGIGIPADELNKLFERFFRTTTVGAVDGTGLGLSIVKAIVDVHDGTIAVDSTERVGTTFHVDLPRLPTSEAHRPRIEVSG